MASPSTSSATTPVDVHARRSCRRCTRRMSSLTHDQHTVCVSCRDINCSVAVRCDKCREWSTETMNEYVRYKHTLVSKSRKPKVTTPSASSASVPPSGSPSLSQVASPFPSSVADDEILSGYVQSFLASMLSQQSGQVSLGTNPTLPASSAEVPHLTPRGSTGWKTAESLKSRSVESPSGVVPLPPQEDVMPPTHVSVLRVSSLGLVGVSGVPSPSLGVSVPSMDQLHDRGDIGFTRHIVSARSASASSFDPSSLLFPFSDSGFSSLSAPTPLASFSASLSSPLSVASASSSSISSSTVPIFSLPSVVPSVLSTPLPLAPPLPPPTSFSVAPPPGFASSFASLLVASASSLWLLPSRGALFLFLLPLLSPLGLQFRFPPLPLFLLHRILLRIGLVC